MSGDFEDFINLNMHTLSVGVPSQLLQHRPDIRQAERELKAAGLDVKVARARFFPWLTITAGVGYEAFNPRYLFITPEALIANVAGDLVAPLINKKAIKADYLSANARQLQSVYNYQRVILNAFTEVINRLSMVEKYRKSLELKKQQLESLDALVDFATKLFQNARADYMEVLFVLRDQRQARTELVETKQQQLSAIVNTYQALGGGSYLLPIPIPEPLQSHRKKHLRHSHASEAAERGPVPLPTPEAAAEGGPEPPPTPAAERGPKPLPRPAAETDLEPLPRPAAERGPVPLPRPAAERGPEPLPTPMGGGKGSDTMPEGSIPM